MTYVKQRKGWRMSCDVGQATEGWRMSCDVGEVTERLENELCYDYNYELCSFSNLSVTSPMSQLIPQPFRRFTYVTANSPTLPLLHLRHILQPFFRLSYVTGSSLNSPGESPMVYIQIFLSASIIILFLCTAFAS